MKKDGKIEFYFVVVVFSSSRLYDASLRHEACTKIYFTLLPGLVEMYFQNMFYHLIHVLFRIMVTIISFS